MRSRLLPVMTALLTLGIFIVDTTTPYEVSVATFYVVVVLLASRFCSTEGIITVAACCVALTVISFVLTPDGRYRLGISNASISIVAIAATTYLTIEFQAAREAAERAQSTLAHVARVTTLGEMAASIAHEVNQPLAAIVTNANAGKRWIQAGTAQLDKVVQSIDNIAEDATRASAIIARIRSLATRAEPKRERMQINDAVEDVLELMRARLREERIAVRVRLAPDLPAIFGDRVQLQQVVLNLMVNAIDAINAAADGERIIDLESVQDQHRNLTVSLADSGIGLDPARSSQLFEAFHSTKSDGMGIGLSICRSIVEAHEGTIWAGANKPRGAIFCFTIPSEKEIVR